MSGSIYCNFSRVMIRAAVFTATIDLAHEKSNGRKDRIGYDYGIAGSGIACSCPLYRSRT